MAKSFNVSEFENKFPENKIEYFNVHSDILGTVTTLEILVSIEKTYNELLGLYDYLGNLGFKHSHNFCEYKYPKHTIMVVTKEELIDCC